MSRLYRVKRLDLGRYILSPANVRSTTHRLGNTSNPAAVALVAPHTNGSRVIRPGAVAGAVCLGAGSPVDTACRIERNV